MPKTVRATGAESLVHEDDGEQDEQEVHDLLEGGNEEDDKNKQSPIRKDGKQEGDFLSTIVLVIMGQP